MTEPVGGSADSALSIRNAFEVPTDIVYLNCASLAPRLRSITAAGQAALERMAAPWSIQAPDWFRNAKTLSGSFARLIRAPEKCATLVPSVSYGIAVAVSPL